MKKQYLTFILLIITSAVFAQGPIARGQSQLNAGLGFSSWGVPVYVGMDFGVHPDITLGGEISFRSYHENYNTYTYNHAVVGLSGNANYHFNTIMNIEPRWDFYAGINLGFYFWNSPDNYDGTYASGLGLGGQIGGRYYFTNNFGINLEFGGGNAFSGGKIGISLKF